MEPHTLRNQFVLDLFISLKDMFLSGLITSLVLIKLLIGCLMCLANFSICSKETTVAAHPHNAEGTRSEGDSRKSHIHTILLTYQNSLLTLGTLIFNNTLYSQSQPLQNCPILERNRQEKEVERLNQNLAQVSNCRGVIQGFHPLSFNSNISRRQSFTGRILPSLSLALLSCSSQRQSWIALTEGKYLLKEQLLFSLSSNTSLVTSQCSVKERKMFT